MNNRGVIKNRPTQLSPGRRWSCRSIFRYLNANFSRARKFAGPASVRSRRYIVGGKIWRAKREKTGEGWKELDGRRGSVRRRKREEKRERETMKGRKKESTRTGRSSHPRRAIHPLGRLAGWRHLPHGSPPHPQWFVCWLIRLLSSCLLFFFSPVVGFYFFPDCFVDVSAGGTYLIGRWRAIGREQYRHVWEMTCSGWISFCRSARMWELWCYDLFWVELWCFLCFSSVWTFSRSRRFSKLEEKQHSKMKNQVFFNRSYWYYVRSINTVYYSIDVFILPFYNTLKSPLKKNNGAYT